MVGVSMGGFIAFRALVIDDRIGVAAPVIASPYFDESLKSNYRQRPDNLKFIQEENIGHEFTASMWHNVIKWFNKHL